MKKSLYPEPKFKIGDEVKSESGQIFVIEKMMFRKHRGYFYSREGMVYYEEGELTHYEKEKPKKLYAYRMSPTGEIKFFDNEPVIINGLGSEGLEINISKFTKRAPEFDINYPFPPGFIMELGQDEKPCFIRL